MNCVWTQAYRESVSKLVVTGLVDDRPIPHLWSFSQQVPVCSLLSMALGIWSRTNNTRLMNVLWNNPISTGSSLKPF